MPDQNESPILSSYYILNREHFAECFDESVDTHDSFKSYRLAFFFIAIAVALFISELDAYAAWFLLVLGVIEVLSIRYKRSWWITRQMFSRAAGSKVNLHIDDQGIRTDSIHNQQAIHWQDINNIKQTEKGFVITHKNGDTYLSKSGLDEDMLALIDAKAGTLN